MLQVNNCKVLALCALMLIAVGCKKDKENEPSPAQSTQSIAGNVATPSWTLSDDYDMSSSMTVVTKVDLALTYASEVSSTGWEVAAGDLLAAFEGETCVGLAQPIDGLFYLYVTASQSGADVALKYYSAKLKNIFVAQEKLTYSTDDRIGDIAEPYTPKWTVAK